MPAQIRGLLASAVAVLASSAPVAAQSDPPRTGPISGYMEMHLNAPLDRADGDAVLDFHRFVLLFSHSFSDRLRFVGELELEHAFVEWLEEAGEVELEQAYIDLLINSAAPCGGVPSTDTDLWIDCSSGSRART